MSKLIITAIDLKKVNDNIAYNKKTSDENIKYEQSVEKKIFCGLYEDKRFYEVNFWSSKENEAAIGNIYIGKVKDVVKNINAAFVEYRKGCIGYLSLEENKNLIFLNKKNTDKVCEGDDIIVQIEKAAIKTKFPVLTSKISITGKSVVVNIGKSGIGFSGKLKDASFKKEIHLMFDEMLEKSNEQYGMIIRTNAKDLSKDEIKSELNQIMIEWNKIKETAKTRKCFALLKAEEAKYIKYIKNAYKGEIEEIITDDELIYNELMYEFNNCPKEGKLLNTNDKYIDGGHINSEHFNVENKQPLYEIRLYRDELLPLYKLYSIENVIKEVKAEKVWLKSGAYLVIQPTEAMTVIDVNTGKCIKGKKLDETIYNVNIEAAKEIAFQMRLRNMSGIIMVDFINMDNKKSQLSLLEYLNGLVHMDRIKTNVVDITSLNIVEITRKKTEPPVNEQLKIQELCV